MNRKNKNYSNDQSSIENYNIDDKYATTGESSFSRNMTIPFDENEELSERNYGYRGEFGTSFRDNHVGKGPKGYSPSDDKIKEDVCEKLYVSPSVDASEIEVSVKDGVVHLQGSVSSRSLKKLMEDIVESTPGVIDVRNEIKISPHRYGLTDNITGMN